MIPRLLIDTLKYIIADVIILVTILYDNVFFLKIGSSLW